MTLEDLVTQVKAIKQTYPYIVFTMVEEGIDVTAYVNTLIASELIPYETLYNSRTFDLTHTVERLRDKIATNVKEG